MIYFSAIVISCLMLVIILDRVVFSLYHMHINLTLIQMALGPARQDIFVLTFSEYLSLGLALSAVITLECLLYFTACYINNRTSQIKKKLNVIFVCGIFIFITGQISFAWADAAYKTTLLSTTEYIPWYYGFTAKRFLNRIGLANSTSRPDLTEKTVKPMRYPIKKLDFSASKKQKEFKR